MHIIVTIQCDYNQNIFKIIRNARCIVNITKFNIERIKKKEKRKEEE